MALLVLASIVFWKDAAAAEWALKGFLDQQFRYNDNISFSNIRKESVVGYLLTPRLEATRKTGTLDIAFEGQGDIRRYDDPIWDCDNYNLGLNNGYRTKRSVFSLSGGYAISCSYSQQITDTGLLAPNGQSVNYRLAPAWAWQWTARDQLNLGTSYSKTSYSNPLGVIASSSGNIVSFSSNDTYTINLGGSHIWSRRLSLNGNLNFSNVQYTGTNASTQNLFGFQLGANYAINHYWTVSASGGPRWVDGVQQRTDSVSSGQNSSLSLGSIANINLSYDDRFNQFSIGYSNSVSPSAIGQTLQAQSVFANYSYHLTQHLLLDLSSYFTSSQSIGSQSTDNTTNQFNRSYFTAAVGIGWELGKKWQLKGSYVYRWQDFQQDKNVLNLNVGTSESNLVMLSLIYSWDGIRKSR
ncbi:MAG: hypothetical protein PHY16_19485 [Methylobacter sp.]|nr:hypothetical protein [Methylobacter sp.]